MVLKNTRDELPMEMGCVWGMPSLSPLSSLGCRHYFYNWKQLRLKKTATPYVSVPEMTDDMINSKTKGAHE